MKSYTIPFMLSILLFSTQASASVINLVFDNTFDNTLSPNYVGTGIITFDEELGDGLYTLRDLSNVTMQFTFGSTIFTYASIQAPTLNLSLNIYNGGTGFYFSSPPSGENNSAVEFRISEWDILHTEPDTLTNEYTNRRYVLQNETGFIQGTYGVENSNDQVSNIPEPTSIVLLATGLIGFCASHRKKDHA